MRAADDFRVIRLRLEELEREREWVAHKRERALREEEADWRTAQQLKDERKVRGIIRSRPD